MNDIVKMENTILECCKTHTPESFKTLEKHVEYIYDFEHCFVVACIYDNVQAVDWLTRHFRIFLDINQIFGICANNGSISVAKWIALRHPYVISTGVIVDNAFKTACSRGNLEFAKWLHSENTSVMSRSIEVFNLACNKKKKEVALWLHQYLPEQLKSEVCKQLLVCGAYHHVKMMFQSHVPSKLLKLYFQSIVEFGTIDEIVSVINKYIMNLQKIIDCISVFMIVSRGDVDLLNCVCVFMPQLYDFNVWSKMFSIACSKNHIDIVKWMYTKCPENIGMIHVLFGTCCMNKSSDVIKWMLDVFPQLNTLIPELLYHGVTDVNALTVFKQHYPNIQTPDDKLYKCYGAISSTNNADCAKIFSEMFPHFVPDKQLLLYATQHKSIDILKLWKYECTNVANDIFLTACTHGCTEIVAWIYSLGNEIGNEVDINEGYALSYANENYYTGALITYLKQQQVVSLLPVAQPIK